MPHRATRGSRSSSRVWPGCASELARCSASATGSRPRQENVDTFAKLTGDEQYIHVDPERAATGPFGTTVQHGFLTLGTATGLLWSVCVVEGFNVILNYGLNKVRFPAPLKVGSRSRMHVELTEVNELEGGAEAVYRLKYEVEDSPKPCCVADLVFRYYT